MNKVFSIMLAAIFLLSACGSQPTSVDKNEEDNQKQDTANNQSKETNEGEQEVEKPSEEEDLEAIDKEVDKQKEPTYKMNEDTFVIEPITDANAKVALITIDDAPDKYALEMAKTLKALDAPAIFL